MIDRAEDDEVVDLAIFRIYETTFWLAAGSKLLVGSSRNNICGAETTMDATERRRFCPESSVAISPERRLEVFARCDLSSLTNSF